MAFLVTGGAGRLARALATLGADRVASPPRLQLDICDASAVDTAIARMRPSVVINPAAVSSPDRAAGAQTVNAEAPGLLGQACARYGVPLIQISTDYVFGAPTDRPWREADPVSPINTYGRQKAEGERRVLASGARACVVRVAWLFGDGGDFITRLLQDAASGGTVRVADDQVGSPTPIDLLAGRLLTLATWMEQGRELPPILHLAGSPPVSRADWVATAFDAIAKTGRETPALVRSPMAGFPDVEPRPRYSALDCSLARSLYGEPLEWIPTAKEADRFTGRQSQTPR